MRSLNSPDVSRPFEVAIPFIVLAVDSVSDNEHVALVFFVEFRSSRGRGSRTRRRGGGRRGGAGCCALCLFLLLLFSLLFREVFCIRRGRERDRFPIR